MNTLGEMDVFYISYDEPDAEAHWADLLNKVPYARRVHGVKGFDAAHKECARRSSTPHFITVDGDNYVDPRFFEQNTAIAEEDRSVYSWASRNIINDLVYGNGGVKCWPTDFVLNMHTHEAADAKRSQVDFCWDANYLHMPGVFSTTHPNASPEQAFRAGFREGVKMCLNNGERVTRQDFERLPETNRMRLFVWMSIGADVDNGKWAMLGARAACYNMLVETSWNHTCIRDFDSLRSYYRDFQRVDVDKKLTIFGNCLRDLGMIVAELDADASRFFKLVDAPPRDKILQR